jgi:glycosyltransferase involved in cell wall biosynthesis
LRKRDSIDDANERFSGGTRFPRAHFVGEMRYERLATAYASADVFVFPSLTDTFGSCYLKRLPLVCRWLQFQLWVYST